MIDWQRLFDTFGVDYVVGPAQNVRRGRLGLNCPRCGDDTKYHFSVDQENGKVVGCWRDRSHWMSPVTLLAAVARITEHEAKKVLDAKEVSMPTGKSAAMLLAEFEGTVSAPLREQAVELLPEFKRFKGHPSERRFVDYMCARGFDDPVATAKRFKLRWCSTGIFKHRIIFQVIRDGVLRGWSGRAIGPATAKYRAYPSGDAMASLLWESSAAKGLPLIISEGPFDALKVAASADVLAVALLTNSAGPAKLSRLIELAGRSSSVTVLLDNGAEGQAVDLQASLSIIRPRLAFVPSAYKDPGEMPLQELKRFIRKVTK